MAETKSKSIGQAIDEIVNALNGIDAKDQLVVIQAACSHLSLILVPQNVFGSAPASSPTQNTTFAEV